MFVGETRDSLCRPPEKEVHEEMEADSVNWDTIVEVLPVGEGEEYEERVK